MPPAVAGKPAQHAPQPSFANLSEDERRHVAAIDAAINRMRKITPPEPYYITVPQEEQQKYRHQSRARAFQWTCDTPFDPNGEREWQQYQTFVFREPGKNLLALHSSDSVFPKPAPEPRKDVTATNTPNHAPKKGMSLGAYKKRKAGESATGDLDAVKEKEQTAKQPALKGPAERTVSKESEEMLAAVRVIEQEDSEAKALEEKEAQQAQKTKAEKLELKRKREDSAKAQEKQTGVDGHASPPPGKKVRTTPSVPLAKQIEKRPSPPPTSTSKVGPASPTYGTEFQMPPKLSPLHDHQSELEKDGFPPRLTPTLPANILASLEQRKKNAATNGLNQPSTAKSAIKKDNALTPSLPQNGSSKHKSPIPRNGFRTQSNSPAVGAVSAPQSNNNLEEHTKDPTTNHGKNSLAEQASVKSRIVKLKYKKARQETVRRILALPPRPTKVTPPPSIASRTYEHTKGDAVETSKPISKSGDAARRTGKGVAQKVGPATKKVDDGDRQVVSAKRPIVELQETAGSEPQQTIAKRKRIDEPKPVEAKRKQIDDAREQELAAKKTKADVAKPTGLKPNDSHTESKQQDKTKAQEPTPRKAKTDNVQPADPKAAGSAKEKQTDHNAQQEPSIKKKQHDQARYEPSSKKRNIDESVPQAVAKAKPDPLELKKTPSTPGQRDIQSPTVSSANKSQHITPGARKDLVSAMRQREASNDSQTSTPTNLANTPLTNSQASTLQPCSSQPNSSTKAPSSQPSNKTPLQQVWETEKSHLELLGRELKHASSDLLKALNPSGEQKKLAAGKAMESLLCFLLAYTCADQVAIFADPKQIPPAWPWRSMTGFFQFVQRTTRDFPLLAGVAAWMGVVLNAHILDLTVQTQSASSGTNLTKVNISLLSVAAEAESKLDLDALIESFPRAWAARTKGSLGVEHMVAPKKMLEGAFKFPIGVQTSPIHGVRAGMALLKEWLEKEGVRYEFKLGS